MGQNELQVIRPAPTPFALAAQLAEKIGQRQARQGTGIDPDGALALAAVGVKEVGVRSVVRVGRFISTQRALCRFHLSY